MRANVLYRAMPLGLAATHLPLIFGHAPPVPGHGGHHPATSQKREKKPKMSDAEVLSHLSECILLQWVG